MTPDERREYYAAWYAKKSADPDWMARKRAKTAARRKRIQETDPERWADLLDRERAEDALARRKLGMREYNGPGSLVPLDEQRSRAKDKYMSRYHNDPEFKSACNAATKASRQRRIDNETPEMRAERLARERVYTATYAAKRRAAKAASGGAE